MKWFLLAVFVLSASSIAEQKDRLDGNYLLDACQAAVAADDRDFAWKNANEAYQAGYCFGVVEGVAKTAADRCYPDGVTYLQAQRIVVKYLQDHPAELHHWDTSLIQVALYDAFPCPPNKRHHAGAPQ